MGARTGPDPGGALASAIRNDMVRNHTIQAQRAEQMNLGMSPDDWRIFRLSNMVVWDVTHFMDGCDEQQMLGFVGKVAPVSEGVGKAAEVTCKMTGGD